MVLLGGSCYMPTWQCFGALASSGVGLLAGLFAHPWISGSQVCKTSIPLGPAPQRVGWSITVSPPLYSHCSPVRPPPFFAPLAHLQGGHCWAKLGIPNACGSLTHVAPSEQASPTSSASQDTQSARGDRSLHHQCLRTPNRHKVTVLSGSPTLAS